VRQVTIAVGCVSGTNGVYVSLNADNGGVPGAMIKKGNITDLPPFGLANMPYDEWNRVMDVNFRGPLLCTQAVVPSMEARGGGRIVNGLSAGGFMPGGIYGVSKFALHGLTVNLASELGGRGINVNAIAPGLVDNESGYVALPKDSPFRDAIAAGIPGKSVPVTVPVTDANTIIQQLYQAAGQGGGIILDFTPDTAPALMKAAEAQGLIDKVKWGSSTPIANTFMAGQFGNWDGKLFINSEFGLLDASQGPDTRLMLALLKKYTKIDPQAFAQMGFMAGKFATQALLNVKGPVTAKSYNAAVRALKNQKTDMLCKPWYVGNALPYHIPNNWDITVDYKDGKVVLKEKCFAIAPVDKELAQTRVWEKKFNLNTGK